MLRDAMTPEFFHRLQAGSLPDLLGLTIESIAEGEMRGSFAVSPRHMAPNGFLHAASVIALADTLAGYGTVAHLPDGAKGFTTIELKTNFLGTALEGRVRGTCKAIHLGRTTHVWDATVSNDAGKTIALFRATQMILY